MKCPKCGKGLEGEPSFCSECGEKTVLADALAGGPVKIGDIGMVKGNLIVNVQEPRRKGSPRPAQKLYKCGICGQRNREEDTFDCNKCDAGYLCKEHLVKGFSGCEVCHSAQQKPATPEARARPAGAAEKGGARTEDRRKAASKAATLHLVTEPAGAKVWVDGDYVGPAPVKLPLAKGRYRIEAEKGGFESWKGKVRFDADRNARLDIALKRVPSSRAIRDDVVKFVDDDEGYLGWAAGHPDGFIVNCERSLNPNYLMLHKASCRTISGTPARGKDWTKDYVKVCSTDVHALEVWAENEVGGQLKRCGLCRP